MKYRRLRYGCVTLHVVTRVSESGGTWKRRGRKILIWSSATLALLLVAIVVTGYVMFRQFNGNIKQDDISGFLGHQPPDAHPKAQNILIIGSDSRQGVAGAGNTALVTDQSDTMMLVHIPGNRQWAEVMSIPRDSWVDIPACVMGDGQRSSPHRFKINEAFAIGNLYGNHTDLGVACTVKTLEQDTGIYISHFVVVNFNGFKDMVAALAGVRECNPVPFNDPSSGIVLSAGYHWLTPDEALAYVRARYALGNGSDLERITRQQAFMSSLISRAKGEMYNPVAMYGFLNAATRSLTVDSQLGGLTGLYDLGRSLRGIPGSKIAFFTLPNYPRGDGANVLWTQPEDSQIFASFRNDVPANNSLVGTTPAGHLSAPSTATARPGKFGAPPSEKPSTPAAISPVKIPVRTANQSICVS
jgi:LCP family protein required for cell wall assembly